jgi:hypothetical protein
MNCRELIETLTYLKENRKLGSESDALVAPFKGLVCSVEFRFESMSRTFANPHDPAFEGGQTVVGEKIGENLEFSLLLPPIELEWAESLEKGEQFEGTAKFLGFDGLYQRGIFGYLGKLEAEDEDDASSDEPEGETDEPVVEEESVENKKESVEEQEEPMDQLSGDEPEEVRENLSVEPAARQDEEATEPNHAVVPEVPQTQPNEEADPVPREPVSPDQVRIEEKTESVQSNDPKPGPKKKVASRDEIARVMDKKYDEGLESLSPKERKIYFKERNRSKVRKKHSWKLVQTVEEKESNRSEVMRVMDKQYDQGIESLTQEERSVYEKEQGSRKKKNLPDNKPKPKKPGQFRLFLGVMLLFASVISIGNGAAGLFFFFVFLIVYFLHPWVSFWIGEDPCSEIFKSRLLKEKRFRRGAGLFVLSLCLFSSAPVLGLILFFTGLIIMLCSKTYEDFTKNFKK